MVAILSTAALPVLRQGCAELLPQGAPNTCMALGLGSVIGERLGLRGKDIFTTPFAYDVVLPTSRIEENRAIIVGSHLAARGYHHWSTVCTQRVASHRYLSYAAQICLCPICGMRVMVLIRCIEVCTCSCGMMHFPMGSLDLYASLGVIALLCRLSFGVIVHCVL